MMEFVFVQTPELNHCAFLMLFHVEDTISLCSWGNNLWSPS